jgi:DNA-binding transcriptional ArsR family regulator
MRKQAAIKVFESLSSGIRLDVYRLLVKHAPEGLVAGEISDALDVPPANLSFHLKAMTQARLVSVQQEGRFQRYRANLRMINDLIEYLSAECCAGNPKQCAELAECAPPRNRRARALETESER